MVDLSFPAAGNVHDESCVLWENVNSPGRWPWMIERWTNDTRRSWGKKFSCTYRRLVLIYLRLQYLTVLLCFFYRLSFFIFTVAFRTIQDRGLVLFTSAISYDGSLCAACLRGFVRIYLEGWFSGQYFSLGSYIPYQCLILGYRHSPCFSHLSLPHRTQGTNRATVSIRFSFLPLT